MGSTRGDVQLVREQPHAAAEKRANAGDANRVQTLDVAKYFRIPCGCDVMGTSHRGSRIPDPGSRLDPLNRIAARRNP